jgi:hypothetical protein
LCNELTVAPETSAQCKESRGSGGMRVRSVGNGY